MSQLKRLIILDLNGLLIHRVHETEYVKCQRLLTEQYVRTYLTGSERIGHSEVWFRPNVKIFLAWLMEHFHVAIWSSVLRHNLEPIVKYLLPDKYKRDRLLFWWDQQNCHVENNPTATDPKNAKSYFKRLTSVWNAASINNRWSTNQPENTGLCDHTLLIDDNVLKARDNPPYTAIHPRSWKRFEFDDNNRTLTVYEDNVLYTDGQLRTWLEGLLEWNGTVADYVQQHPYIDPPL
ncbi:unnamed protein product [Adineta steineri]|uniref:Mitochondrial import inner membrane translocase subunit TIM50 n=1 Tax=Adineta steineri TaxID=433720 RepID=A0A813UJ50_9BILA|nr:unnamed protein product [Adineta steineri]CAF0877624.1 unnamed protein product [Adineta steineri]CAF4053587.1 unnamed protein product [Adineta steineri]CAF4149790.1 unnamed protein product [Adineta steineri]